MKKYLQKGKSAILVVEYLSDRSQVFNVAVNVNVPTDRPGEDVQFELQCKDEEAAQKLFNCIEENCVGVR